MAAVRSGRCSGSRDVGGLACAVVLGCLPVACGGGAAVSGGGGSSGVAGFATGMAGAGGAAGASGSCSNGMVWCSCSNSYSPCGADGSADVCTCPGTVIIGGDAGTMLPDPGVIFVDTAAPPVSLAADPTRNVVYVTSHFEEARAISTDTGASLWVVSATIVHPDTLVVSDDGSTLYALDIQLGLIDRVITATGRVDLTIALPIDPSGGTRPEIQDLAVVPGSPRTVVVIAGQQETLWALDDDVPRAAVGQANVSYVRMDGPSTIYAVAAGGSFVTFTLAPSGVQAGAAGPVSGLFGPNVGEFLFDGELAFDDKGQVVDPRRGVLLGSYGVTGSVAVDRTGNRSYLAWPTNAPANDLQIVIGEFDRTAFTRLRTLTLSLQSGNALLVRARDGTLAAGGFLQGPQTTNGVALVRPDAWQAATSP